MKGGDSVLTPSRTWTSGWRIPEFRIRAIGSFLFLGTTLFLFSHFILFIEERPGSRLHDPLLSLFQPENVGIFTFGLIYGGVIAAIILLARKPDRLLFVMQSYAVLTLLRIVCMYLLPLDPPETTIPLRDPFVELFGSGGTVLTRDLFFSGHTSMLVLLGLGMNSPLHRALFFVGAFLVAACVLLQHVHYTIDVVAAPMAAFVAFAITRSLPWNASPCA